MLSVNQMQFTLKDSQFTNGKEVYIRLMSDRQNQLYRMDKKNGYFSKGINIQLKVRYIYRYMVSDLFQNQIEEKGFRNYKYNKQILFQDEWNKKEVILIIYTKQQLIMNALQIIVNQKVNSENLIKNFNLELHHILYQNKISYKGIIKAESAMNILEFIFIFNDTKQYNNQYEQRYTNTKSYYYSSIKVVNNQSIIEIYDDEFEELSKKKNFQQQSTAFSMQLQNQPCTFNPYFELSNDSVQNLLQIYETSFRFFQESLKQKDQQIKQLTLERLEQEQIVFFNNYDQFQQDVYSEYKNQFYQIVEEFQGKQTFFLQQFREKEENKESQLKEYKQNISNNDETIKNLLEKVNQLKKTNQKIEALEKEILKYKEMLKRKIKIVEELEKELMAEKEKNQYITKEKEKFQIQIIGLDKEMEEYKKRNEINSQEKDNLIKEKQVIDEQLNLKINEIQNQIQNEIQHKNQLKDSQQLIKQFKDSQEIQKNIIKESRVVLIKLISNYLKDIKGIIGFHKEVDIQTDIQNLQNQLAQIEINLRNFEEEKISLEYFESNLQLQVHQQLQYLCTSDRIKPKERSQIKDIQNYLNQVLDVLKKFDKIKEKMVKSQIQLRHQPTEATLQNIKSLRIQRQVLKKMDTLR